MSGDGRTAISGGMLIGDEVDSLGEIALRQLYERRRFLNWRRLGPSLSEQQASERRSDVVHMTWLKIVESYVVNTL
jgi:hypothetical protein